VRSARFAGPRISHIPNHRLVTLSGPSGVGKGALTHKLRQLAPRLGLSYGRTILYTSRPRRSGEVDGRDAHFRTREEIVGLPDGRFVKANVHPTGDGNSLLVQALDLEEVARLLDEHRVALAEVYYTFVPRLVDFAREHNPGIELIRVFLAPLSDCEIAARARITGQSPDEVVYAEMRCRLTARRALGLSDETDEELEVRARGCVEELRFAGDAEVTLINHNGEDSPLWRRDDPYAMPEGEAREVFDRFVSCLTPA
jgi:guanylate kinase